VADASITLALLVGLFLLLVAIRLPIAYAMIVSVVAVLFLIPGISMKVVAAQMLTGINIWPLLAVPLFLLAGELMLRGGTTRPLVAAVQSIVGPVPGGLAQTGVVSHVLMAGMSGSDIADVSAIGGVLLPALKQAKYPAPFSAAIIAGAGALAPLIPPSIALIIYGLVTNTSVARLFAAAAVPAGLLILSLLTTVYIVALRRNFPREPRVSLATTAHRWALAAPSLLIPVVIIGGILGGIFTPTEASAVAVVCALLLGLFVYKGLKIRQLPSAFVASAKTSASVLMIIAAASLLGLILTIYNVGPPLTEALTSSVPNVFVFLLTINVVLLLLGAIFEAAPVIVVIVPLLLKSVEAYHIDPVHFGVMVVFNTLIGLMLPPFGLAMFIVCRLANITIGQYSREMIPILLAMLVVLALVTFVPQVTVALPDALHIR
jgi:tripartite ATP-independent transporter DctM subunit